MDAIRCPRDLLPMHPDLGLNCVVCDACGFLIPGDEVAATIYRPDALDRLIQECSDYERITQTPPDGDKSDEQGQDRTR